MPGGFTLSSEIPQDCDQNMSRRAERVAWTYGHEQFARDQAMKYVLFVGLALLALFVLAVVINVVLILWRSRGQFSIVGEVLPSEVMQGRYGLYAENRPEIIKIDPSNVPEHLRDLIPMAEKWGIGDDIIRCDFEKKASAEEKEEFREALRGRTDQVTAWLDSFEVLGLPEDAGPFMYMLEALDESGLWPD
jgi:hypothetical protein